MAGKSSYGFDLIDHTADVGIRAWGETVSDLFIASAEAMFSLIVGRESVEDGVARRVEIASHDWEALLFDWLDELLYLHEVEGFLLNRVDSIQVEPFNLTAELIGDTFDPMRHDLQEQIKAVTFHGLQVTETPRWSAQVIFDV